MTIAILIALLLGGGTSFAAENALPGDTLYPIKIHINENVQELAAVSDEAEAKVQAKLAERRLEEAEKLAAKGILTAETSADLRTRFEEHSEKSKEHRLKVRNVNAVANISSDIEVSLGMHRQILEDIGDSRPEMKGFLDEILGGVGHRLKEVGEERFDIETKVFAGMGSDTQSSAEGTMKAAQNKIDQVKKFVESRKDTLSTSVQTEVGLRVKATNATMAEGKAKMEAKAYADAFALFKKAAREAQEAKLFVSAMSDLKIETVNNGEARLKTDTEQHKESAAIEVHNETDIIPSLANLPPQSPVNFGRDFDKNHQLIPINL